MPDDPAATATEVKPVPSGEGEGAIKLAADFETAEPKPDVEPDASIEIEEPPEKSASERYLDDLMELPPDERKALLSGVEKRMEEAGDAVPWRERQDAEIAARTAAASQDVERERRQEELRSWKSNADAARANAHWITNDLSERWEKRGVDDPAPRHDAAELDRQLTALTNAEAGLLSHAAITEIGNAMNAGLEEYGGPITSEELNQIATAEGRGDKVKAYMKSLAERVRKETTVEVEKDMDRRIKEAVALEAGAKAADANRKVKVAPEATGKSAKTTELTIEEIDEGLRSGPTSEIDSLLEKREQVLAQ